MNRKIFTNINILLYNKNKFIKTIINFNFFKNTKQTV